MASMFSVRDLGGHPAFLELCDGSTGSSVKLAPSRGALVSSFRVGTRELLYLDEGTLRDPALNVRGGVPLLFPSPGKLVADTWAFRGASGHLSQHGFARTLPWTVEHTGTEGAAHARLGLAWRDVKGEAFPWDVDVTLDVTLALGVLTLRLGALNRGSTDMPFAAGFHPYFAVPDSAKGRLRVPTRATRAFDNRRKESGPFAGLDFTAEELDAHLLDHGANEARLELDDGTLLVGGSDELDYWVLWTLRGKDFVCVEPWSAPGNALNTGERLRVVAPGARCEVTMTLAWRPR